MDTTRFLTDMRKRLVRDFLDILILTELRKGRMSGYDIIESLHSKYRILISPGSVYSVMYSLERKGLISGIWIRRKRVYKLTEIGEKTITEIIGAKDSILCLVSSLFKLGSSSHNEGCNVPLLGHCTPNGV